MTTRTPGTDLMSTRLFDGVAQAGADLLAHQGLVRRRHVVGPRPGGRGLLAGRRAGGLVVDRIEAGGARGGGLAVADGFGRDAGGRGRVGALDRARRARVDGHGDRHAGLRGRGSAAPSEGVHAVRDQVDVLVGHRALGRVALRQDLHEPVHGLDVLALLVEAHGDLHRTAQARASALVVRLGENGRACEAEQNDGDDGDVLERHQYNAVPGAIRPDKLNHKGTRLLNYYANFTEPA